jgi:hypothetical protein
MKKGQIKRFGLALLGIITAFFVFAQCNNSTNPQQAFTGPLELLQPKGGSGQSFKVGDPVTIKWSIHDQNQIGSVVIVYSLDSGKTWGANSLAINSFTYPETTYVWTPTSLQKSDQFVLKVREYNTASINDKSAPFVVHE